MLLIDRILGRKKARQAERDRDLPQEVTQFQQAQDRKMTYERVFNTPDGEWVLADLAEQFHVLWPSITFDNDDGVDVSATMFQEGKREAVMWIMRYVQSPLLPMASAPDSDYDPLQEVEDE